MKERPEVLVTSCRGADQGAMSVIRTLGRRGVRVSVLSDSDRCLTRHSRHCAAFICRPDYTQDPQGTLAWLQEFAASRSTRPVLFPTADPDLALVSALRAELEPHFRLFLAQESIVGALLDKTCFRDLAALHQLPVPQTHAPETRQGFLAVSETVTYPVVLKPSHPGAWTHPEIQKAVAYRKALVVQSAEELRRIYEAIVPWNADLIVQEYIVGPDDHHYSVHAYVGRDGQPLACFSGRKVRVHPAFAGSGCFVQSVRVPEILEMSLDILHRIRATGVAVLNFKRDSRRGRFFLHEINARVSQWNILATASGVDVPWAAYAEAAGLPVRPMLAQNERLHYVDLRNDLKSLKAYRKVGQWNLVNYLGSLLQRPLVHQLLSVEDPGPFLACLGRKLWGRGRRRTQEALPEPRRSTSGQLAIATPPRPPTRSDAVPAVQVIVAPGGAEEEVS